MTVGRTEAGTTPALDVEIESGMTLRQWLARVLLAFWDEADGFSGKRPLGDSGWYTQIMDALEAAGFDDPDAAVVQAIKEVFSEQ